MVILAHRGNLSGPEPSRENSVGRMGEAMGRGYGLETDIRRLPDGRLYISHDAKSGADPTLELASDHAGLWSKYPGQLVALNLKELGWESALVDFVQQHRLRGQVMLFDMELIETVPGETTKRLLELDRELRIASRVSDRGEPLDRALSIPGSRYIWLDEFDSLWVKRETIARLKDNGREVYAISPELHGFDTEARFKRWDDFAAWGVNGICTDYSEEAEARLNGGRV